MFFTNVFNIFHKSEKDVFNVFYLQINAFNIYAWDKDERFTFWG